MHGQLEQTLTPGSSPENSSKANTCDSQTHNNKITYIFTCSWMLDKACGFAIVDSEKYWLHLIHYCKTTNIPAHSSGLLFIDNPQL